MAGNVKVVLKSVFDDSGVKQAQNILGNLGRNIGVGFAAAGAALTTAAAGITKLSVDAAQAGSGLNESLNAVRVSYGAASEEIIKLGENAAQRLGVTQTEFNQASVRFSAFAERIVGTGGDVAGFVDSITTRATDFASVFNIDVAEALSVFQSGLSGEAEPLKRFGINLLDTEVKAFALRTEMIKQGETLTETQKIQARYGLLMESTNKTAGDFANTSDGLANRQRILQASLSQVQAEIGQRLVPVFEDLLGIVQEDIIPILGDSLTPVADNVAAVFRDKVLPAVVDFLNFLASPEGTDTINKLTDAVLNGIEAFFDFATEVGKNWELIKNVIISVGVFVIALEGLRTALLLAQAAQLLFNFAVGNNPYVIAAIAIATLVSGITTATIALTGFHESEKKAREESTGLTGRLAELVAEQERLKELVDAGVISYGDYEKAIGPINDELGALQIDLKRAADLTAQLNNADLEKYRGQLGDTRIDAEKLVNAQRELAYYMAGGKAGTYKPLASTPESSSGSTGETAAEKQAKAAAEAAAKARQAFERVQDIVQRTQKSITNAQSTYTKSVLDANKSYADNIANIQQTFTSKLVDIVNSSKRRLTNAFSSVATFSTGQFLSDLQKQITETTDRIDPVGEYVKALQNKVLANRRLIETSAQLAQAGFSQTFIEQIIATGDESGIALADGILKSSPATVENIKGLFSEIEQQSETGLDALADQIYEKQGLATSELRDLYQSTTDELYIALEDQQKILENNLRDAAIALQDSLKEIKSDYLADIEELDGSFGGLKGTVDSVTSSLNSLIGKAGSAADAAASSAASAAASQIDFINQIKAASETAMRELTATALTLSKETAAAEAAAKIAAAKVTTPTPAPKPSTSYSPSTGKLQSNAMEAAAAALGTTFNQAFVDALNPNQVSFTKGGQGMSVGGQISPDYINRLIAEGWTQVAKADIDASLANTALNLAEQVYGVDLGALGGSPGSVGNQTTININVTADATQSPAMVGKAIASSLTKFVTTGGQVVVN